MDDSSMAEAQYDPSRETATSIEALSVSTLNRYSSGMEDEGVRLFGEEEEDLSAPLKEALDGGDDAAALRSYQDLQRQGETPTLGSQLEAKLARVLDAAGMPADAIQACRRIVMTDPESPMAPGALFTGARLAAGRLGDQQMAARLLQFLIEKYPNSNLVPQAQDALKNIAYQIQRRG
jgi:tetratricopeptide (TPR) repeat protein